MKTTINLGSDYKRTVDIRNCSNINSFDFTIKDQMLTAKNPEELQSKFQWVMSRDDLYKLRDVITATLLEDLRTTDKEKWIEP